VLVKEIMLENPKTLLCGNTIADACELYNQQGVNCAPVINEEGKVVGILTVFRLLQALKEGASFFSSIEQIMDPNISTFPEDTDFNEVCALPVDRLIILNKHGFLAGVLTRMELINKVHHALEKTESDLSVMLRSIYNGIIGVDHTGEVCYFNAAAEKLTGLVSKDILGQSAEVLLKHLDLDLKHFETSSDPLVERFRIGNKTILIQHSPIEREDHNGGYVLVLQDISALEELSGELQSAWLLNKELEGVIQSCYDGIVVIDCGGTIVRVNDSYLRIIGDGTQEDLIGKNVATLIDKHCQLDSIYKNITASLQSFNLAIKTTDGKDIVFSGSIVTNDIGHIAQIVITLRDFTELNLFKMEAARAALELGELRSRQFEDDDLIFKSLAMQRVVQQALRVAPTDSTVMLNGPSGVGKEKLAKYIHKHSLRAEKPMICINCGAIPEPLIESEFFGYEKGAFTGAHRDGKPGLLELADGGTVFLDEIGDMPLHMQVKLLRALQEQVIYRIGGSKPVKLNIRILAATNKDLKQLVVNKSFREDLYYRLNVIPLHILSLQDRKQDILILAISFLNHFNKKNNMDKKLSLETCQLIENYSWPGNVRELKNLIERVVIMSDEEVITPRHLPIEFREVMQIEEWTPKLMDIIPLQQAKETTERELIRMALETKNSLRKTAQMLGISHSTLLRKAQQYGIMVQS